MSNSKIMLASGAILDILEPETSELNLSDIAHGLGRVCRFAGQASNFYSVAEHAVHVARLVPVELARAALITDGAKAFLGELARPLQALVPDYRKIEARIEEAIVTRFLPKNLRKSTQHPAIKAADAAMYVAEARILMPEANRYWTDQIENVRRQYPTEWELAQSGRLFFDKPEFAASAWLRAWNRYSHLEQDRGVEGKAA